MDDADKIALATINEVIQVAWLKVKGRLTITFRDDLEEQRVFAAFGVGFSAGARWVASDDAKAMLEEEG